MRRARNELITKDSSSTSYGTDGTLQHALTNTRTNTLTYIATTPSSSDSELRNVKSNEAAGVSKPFLGVMNLGS